MSQRTDGKRHTQCVSYCSAKPGHLSAKNSCVMLSYCFFIVTQDFLGEKKTKQLHTIRWNRSCMFLRGSYQGVEWVFIAWGWRSLTSRSGPLTGTCWNKTPKHPHTLVNSVILIMFWRKGQRYTIARCVQIYVKIFV